MSLQTTPPVSQKVLADWQAELDQHFPKSDHTTHLKIVWVSGDDWEIDGVWQGVERFYVFEMFPKDYIDPYLIFEVNEGPRPVVRYDKVMKDVTRSDTFCTRLQWDLFKETGHYAKPFWVIQGDKGGHQRFFSTFEKKWLELQSLPTDPPLPGTLPYAPYDNRVLKQLLRHDRLKKTDGRFAMLRKTRSAEYRIYQEKLERQFREAIVEFLKDQIDQETAKDVLKNVRDDSAIVETDFYQKLEEAEARFVETGSLA